MRKPHCCGASEIRLPSARGWARSSTCPARPPLLHRCCSSAMAPSDLTQQRLPCLRPSPGCSPITRPARPERACLQIAHLGDLLATGGPIAGLAAQMLGPRARPVRAILFDKSAAMNWGLGWHQDRVIAVRSRLAVAGFGPWSIKRGVPHVAPPWAILSAMRTLRIHLDTVSTDNAPLLVAPGSHCLGIVPELDVNGDGRAIGKPVLPRRCRRRVGLCYTDPPRLGAERKWRAPPRAPARLCRRRPAGGPRLARRVSSAPNEKGRPSRGGPPCHSALGKRPRMPSYRLRCRRTPSW